MDQPVTLPQFNLRGSVLDLPDVNTPEGLKSVTFTPNTSGQMVGAGNNLIRPKATNFDLDGSGRLGGANGIYLLANDASLNLSTPLQWSVQVNTADGLRPRRFWFVAPDAGETVWIGDVAAAPFQAAQALTRGPRGVDDVVLAGDSIQFLFHGDPVGDPIPIWGGDIDGGTVSTTSDSDIDGGAA